MKRTKFFDADADDGHWQNEEEELVDPQMNDNECPEQPDQTVITQRLLLLLLLLLMMMTMW